MSWENFKLYQKEKKTDTAIFNITLILQKNVIFMSL